MTDDYSSVNFLSFASLIALLGRKKIARLGIEPRTSRVWAERSHQLSYLAISLMKSFLAFLLSWCIWLRFVKPHRVSCPAISFKIFNCQPYGCKLILPQTKLNFKYFYWSPFNLFSGSVMLVIRKPKLSSITTTSPCAINFPFA